MSQVLRFINNNILDGNTHVVVSNCEDFDANSIDILNGKLKEHGFKGSVINIDGSFVYK